MQTVQAPGQKVSTRLADWDQGGLAGCLAMLHRLLVCGVASKNTPVHGLMVTAAVCDSCAGCWHVQTSSHKSSHDNSSCSCWLLMEVPARHDSTRKGGNLCMLTWQLLCHFTSACCMQGHVLS